MPSLTPKPPKRIGDSPAINRAIGANVRRHRVAKGWSHAQLGSRVGMSHTMMQLYERGAVAFAASLVIKIANALDAPVTDLLDGTKRRDDERAERDTFRLARAMARIRSPQQREKAIELIYALGGREHG
jgi:transcriptional regulator with XRE-family HTH domain